jgi:hypothetical protein
MKKYKVIITFVLLFLATVSIQAEAATDLVVSSAVRKAPADSDRAQQLTTRLEEINAMDKSVMKRSEKRKVRMEVKAINKELKTLSGGVYLSVGAIIIILLLLILLL